MVALNENSIFEAIVRRIETTDPVMGGEPNPATGQAPANIGLLQLANRTLWLFDTIEEMYTNGEIDAAIAAAVGVLTAAEILARIKTVDGPGSGLDADLLDGAHGSAYWKTADAPSLMAREGYQFFPSGLVLQWGQGDSDRTNFPIMFPTASLIVVISEQSPSDTDGFGVVQNTQTFFDVVRNEGETGFSDSYHWIATGY